MAKGIYKRGNVYWIRYAGLNGKTIFESSCSAKFREAEALLISRKQAVKEGKKPEIKSLPNHTFRELAGKYLSWVNGRQKSAQVKGYIIGQLVETFGSLPLRKFNTLIVEQLQTDNINRGIKASTNNKSISVLKAMFTKAVDWEMAEAETLKVVRKAKLLTDDSKRLRFLSKEQCQELIDVCKYHLKPIVITALNTGMRKSEILNLKWDNVDLSHKFILLDATTKNSERREIPINNTLRDTLHGMTRRLNTPYVFHDHITGKPYKNIKTSLKTALKKIKISDFRFHDLRHTFASHLVMAGIDITTVKELLGHKTLTMTLRYAHLATSHKVKAMEVLDNAISETRAKPCNDSKKINYTKTIQSMTLKVLF